MSKDKDRNLIIHKKEAIALLGSLKRAPNDRPSTVFGNFAVDIKSSGTVSLGRLEVRETLTVACQRAHIEDVVVDAPFFKNDAFCLLSTRPPDFLDDKDQGVEEQKNGTNDDDAFDFIVENCFVEGGENGIAVSAPRTLLRRCSVLGAAKYGIIAKVPLVVEATALRFCTLGAYQGDLSEEGDANDMQTGPCNPDVPEPPPPAASMAEAKVSFFDTDCLY